MKAIDYTPVDLLNVGLGLVKAGGEAVSSTVASVQKSVQSTVDEALANVERTIEDLKYKGAADFSEPAVKAREFVTGAVKSVSGSKA